MGARCLEHATSDYLRKETHTYHKSEKRKGSRPGSESCPKEIGRPSHGSNLLRRSSEAIV